MPTDITKRPPKCRTIRFYLEEWDAIAERYSKGESARSLGRELNICVGSITRQLRKRGIPVRLPIKGEITRKAYLSKDLKRCADCKTPKHISFFGRDSSRVDLRRHICKSCDHIRSNISVSKRTEEQKISRREWQRSYQKTESHRGKQKTYARKYHTSIKGRYLPAKLINSKNGKGWSLSFQEYQSLVSQACEYCGGPLPDTGCGLDRLDNKRGYELGNVVPCCSICNYTRRDQFTPDEMRKFIGPAVKALREKRLCSNQQL